MTVKSGSQLANGIGYRETLLVKRSRVLAELRPTWRIGKQRFGRPNESIGGQPRYQRHRIGLFPQWLGPVSSGGYDRHAKSKARHQGRSPGSYTIHIRLYKKVASRQVRRYVFTGQNAGGNHPAAELRMPVHQILAKTPASIAEQKQYAV